MEYYINQNNFPKNMDDCTIKEIRKHHIILLTQTDKIKLFLHYYAPYLFRCAGFSVCKCLRWKQRAQFMHLYQEGKYKIEKDLNLVRLVKMIKRINILMKNSLMTSRVDFEIAH